MIDNLSKVFLFGVGVTNASESDILEYIFSRGGGRYYIVTSNPEILMYASKHKEYKAILNRAVVSLCDGVGLFLASKILKKPLKQRVTGVDLLEKICKESSQKAVTVGFVGGKGDVAERAAECLTKKYPNLKVSFAFGGDPDWETVESIRYKVSRLQSPEAIADGGQVSIKRKTQRDNLVKNGQNNVLKSIKDDQVIDFLFVAFGFPKQEEWVSKYLDQLPVRVAICVGGAFDYISGEVPRAPSFIRSIGFEWFYRLIRQPWRIKRQLALLEFVWLVLAKKLQTIIE